MLSKIFLCFLILQICYYIVSVAMQYFKTNFQEMLLAISFYIIGCASLILDIRWFALVCLSIALVGTYTLRKEQGYIFLNCVKALVFSLLAFISSFFYDFSFYLISIISWFYIAQMINGLLLRYFIKSYLGDEE